MYDVKVGDLIYHFQRCEKSLVLGIDDPVPNCIRLFNLKHRQNRIASIQEIQTLYVFISSCTDTET